ncbi:MAG: S-layer family protein [Deltaproteobacteria bacterium]|nr:S-layer family protein [Deltaproteobacteria bacterium]
MDVTAQSIEMAGGALISATSFGSGDAGNIDARATSNFELRDSGTGILSNAQGSGAGGDVALRTQGGRLRLEDGAAITAQTTRNARAGDISIATGSLELLGGSMIDNSTSAQGRLKGEGLTTGSAGSIEIVASESVRLASMSTQGDTSRVTSRSLAESSGAAGSIRITAPAVRVGDRASISATADGPGTGGEIQLDVMDLALSEEGRISTFAAVGAEGGSPGDGEARSIRIRSTGEVRLRDRSEIEASVGANRGGDVEISRPRSMVLEDESRILAQARADDGSGVGGRIEIRADAFFASPTSTVSADSSAGVNGEVILTSSIATIEEDLRPVEASLLDAGTLLRPPCEARAASAGGSLVVASKAPEPIDEERWLSSSLVIGERRESQESIAEVEGALRRMDDAGRALADGKLEKARRELDALSEELDDSDRVSTRLLVFANRARLDAEHGSWETAIRSTREARRLADALENDFVRWASRVHLAQTQILLASKASKRRVQLVEGAHRDLVDAVRIARVLGTAREYSASLGRLARRYEMEGHREHSLALVRDAIGAGEQFNTSAELHLWYAMEGRILWTQGRASAALNSYRRAVDAAARLRRAAFRDPRYESKVSHQALDELHLAYIDLLFQSADLGVDADAQSRLFAEVRRVAELSQAVALEDYFRDECVALLESRTRTLDELVSEYGRGSGSRLSDCSFEPRRAARRDVVRISKGYVYRGV